MFLYVYVYDKCYIDAILCKNNGAVYYEKQKRKRKSLQKFPEPF